MTEWHSYTPDGHELIVRRENTGLWFVRCGNGEAHDESLDTALTRAIRATTPPSCTPLNATTPTGCKHRPTQSGRKATSNANRATVRVR
jgi:hypothetical protein